MPVHCFHRFDALALDRHPARARCASFAGAALALLLLAAPGRANPLNPALFQTDFEAFGSAGVIRIHTTEILPIGYDSGLQQTSNGTYDVSVSFTGGPAPSVRTQGFLIPGSAFGPFLLAPVAGIGYQVRPTPLPLYANSLAGLQIIVNVTGAFSASIGPVPGPTLAGFAEASVRITGPGVSIFEGVAVGPTTPDLHLAQSFAHRLTLFPGTPITVNLLARGNAVGTWDAFADPVFSIDPDQTFLHEGEWMRVADAVRIEYPPNLVPEPGTGLLVAGGAGALAALRHRRRG